MPRDKIARARRKCLAEQFNLGSISRWVLTRLPKPIVKVPDRTGFARHQRRAGENRPANFRDVRKRKFWTGRDLAVSRRAPHSDPYGAIPMEQGSNQVHAEK